MCWSAQGNNQSLRFQNPSHSLSLTTALQVILHGRACTSTPPLCSCQLHCLLGDRSWSEVTRYFALEKSSCHATQCCVWGLNHWRQLLLLVTDIAAAKQPAASLHGNQTHPVANRIGSRDHHTTHALQFLSVLLAVCTSCVESGLFKQPLPLCLPTHCRYFKSLKTRCHHSQECAVPPGRLAP